MKVRPLHDRILVQRLEEGEQKVGGIIIPDTGSSSASTPGRTSSWTAMSI
jgi:co-chaperonin GroES (HSP10)